MRRQLLINTCMAFVVLQVSAPYSRTVLTFVLKILTLVLIDSCFEFQMFLSCKYAALAFPIRAFISASYSPCSSIMLPEYKGFYIFQTFSVNCDWIVACCVASENLVFHFLYNVTYCC
ncbi:unnamed protein product [Schistosoma margrebowiei]|uniref:Uncharacterized protein n=1 Tax=Schistosoma margrebowiei TaxID=48269 RepID=A0A3P7WFD3_9TREM|nr:unnamed protein product [Schistosoma margrebowiei]